MAQAHLSGVGLTAFGVRPGRDALQWQVAAARAAPADAAVRPRDVDVPVTRQAGRWRRRAANSAATPASRWARP